MEQLILEQVMLIQTYYGEWAFNIIALSFMLPVLPLLLIERIIHRKTMEKYA